MHFSCTFTLLNDKFKFSVSTKHCMENGGSGRSLKVSAVRGKKDKAGENCCWLGIKLH